MITVRWSCARATGRPLAGRFFAAAVQGGLPSLEALLAEDVALHADGGGKAPALARPVNGRERVARTLPAGMSAATRVGVRIPVTEVNGRPGDLRAWYARAADPATAEPLTNMTAMSPPGYPTNGKRPQP